MHESWSPAAGLLEACCICPHKWQQHKLLGYILLSNRTQVKNHDTLYIWRCGHCCAAKLLWVEVSEVLLFAPNCRHLPKCCCYSHNKYFFGKGVGGKWNLDMSRLDKRNLDMPRLGTMKFAHVHIRMWLSILFRQQI